MFLKNISKILSGELSAARGGTEPTSVWFAASHLL